MKKTEPVFDEGPAAYERFREAVKTIMSVPKQAVVRHSVKKRSSRKKRVKR